MQSSETIRYFKDDNDVAIICNLLLNGLVQAMGGLRQVMLIGAGVLVTNKYLINSLFRSNVVTSAVDS